MKIFAIAGEVSGDILCSEVIKEVRKINPDVKLKGFGGDKMKEQGVEIFVDLKRLAFMGVIEVIKNYNTIKKNFSICKKNILDFKPDVVLLVDYSGFNMRIAKFCKTNNIKVVYYVSPKYWAWKPKRVKKVKKYVDEMICILPFEKEFYKKRNITNISYVGNPWYQIIKYKKITTKEFCYENNLPFKPIIAIMPGSRKHEVKKILPELLKVIPTFNDKYQFVIGAVNSVPKKLYEKIVANYDTCLLYNKSHQLLYNSRLALLASGTVSLEAAIIGTPQIVTYKVNYISSIIMRSVIIVKFVSLVNICLNFELVRELLQKELNYKSIIILMKQLLFDIKKRKYMLDYYDELKTQLDLGDSSKRVAKILLNAN